MHKNPFISAYSFESQKQDFLKDLKKAKEFSSIELVQTALVLDVDRQGGRFIINRGGNEGNMRYVSVPLTLKVRLLTNYYNGFDGNLEDLPNDDYIDADEYYVLPLFSPNRQDIPERGDVVNIMFNRPFSD